MKTASHYSPKVMIMIGLAFSVILGLFALNLFYLKEIEKYLIKQTYRDLKLENDKTLNYFQSLLENKFEWMEIFSLYCDLPDQTGNENWWNQTEELENEGTWFGIVDDKGNLYYGDHKRTDVSAYEFYQAARNGKRSISRTEAGEFYPENTIVLSVPIIRNNEVKGVVCIGYTIINLEKYLIDLNLSQYGQNLLFSQDGNLIISCDWCKDHSTLYDMLDNTNLDNGLTMDEVRDSLKNGNPGYIMYKEKGNQKKSFLIYYQSFGIEDWMLGSVVEIKGYESTLHRIRILSQGFIAGSMVLLILAVLLMVGILYLRKNEEKRAQKDYLTGVYTRETARKIVGQKLKSVGKNQFYACMFLDIDDFKQINDTLGHQSGDMVLAEVGKILNSCTRKEDVIVRFGGDEFCIWLYDTGERKAPEAIAQRIITAFNLSGRIHASIGITLVREQEEEYDDILKRADNALYEAKRKGKNQYAVQS